MSTFCFIISEMKSVRSFSTSAKVTDIFSLPPELLLHIFTFLPTSDLIRVRRISTQWRDLSKTALITKIQSSWPNPGYWPSAVEVHRAANLVNSGYLLEDVITTLATKIQSSWSDSFRSSSFYHPDAAKVQCAAALAGTGHLTSVNWMVLRDLELPSSASSDMLSLARVVRDKMVLWNVTGDIDRDRLLSSLTCTKLNIFNMELDQAATSSLVRALQHGVEELGLYEEVRLHIQTLVEWDGRGRCGEVECAGDTRDTYKEEMETWAARVNWSVKYTGFYLVMKRCGGEDSDGEDHVDENSDDECSYDENNDDENSDDENNEDDEEEMNNICAE